MKGEIFKTVICSFIFVVLISMFTYASNEKTIEIYNVNNKCFDNLINGEIDTIKFFDTQNKIEYSVIDGNDEYAIKSVIEQGKKTEKTVKYGLYNRIGKVPINRELIEFVSGQGIKGLLSENGINGTLDKTLIFYSVFSDSMDIPPIILVNSEGLNYFITIEYKLNNDSSDYEYVYKFYNQKDFLKKYGIRYGSLKIDNNNFEKGVLFRNNGVLIFLRNTIENLGGSVLWNEESKELKIVCGNNSFTMTTGKNFSFKKNGQQENLFLSKPGTICDFYYDIVDDRLYVNERAMEVILNAINYKIDIDLDKAAIVIKKLGDEND